MFMPDWSQITAKLGDSGVAITNAAEPRPVAGGDISRAWRLDADDRSIFLKTSSAAHEEMFAAEAAGLEELRHANAIQVPGVIATGAIGASAFLAIEWIDFRPCHSNASAVLGEGLAALHRVSSDRYGWHRDNTIGSTPQHNEWMDDWPEFFGQLRLGFQLQLAERNGYGGELQVEGRALADQVNGFFEDYRPQASLLHGDLWGGNWACANDAPIIFDPAVYYGDRETDLAMTRLFGGFDPAFYDAYDHSWPLAAGHERRMQLYQLYHVLNHLNLFGRAYLGRALGLIRALRRC